MLVQGKGASYADGYRYVFVEYGPMELDINLRVRVHELEKALEERVTSFLPFSVPGYVSMVHKATGSHACYGAPQPS